MMNNNSTYKRLGDYIREVDVRNTDLKINKLVGLTIAKAFIPSVANTIGTDLSKYKIIKENQFACSLMQVSRDGKMPVAVFKGEDAIMSPAYPIFEICNEDLLPDYLQMWFSRSEFDREAVFYAVGGVRGSLDWNDFMDMKIPVPPLEEQRSIVSRYKAIETRIANNKQTIAKLEEAAQALYRKMFVDDVDVENLPDGWRMGKYTDIVKLSGGGTPDTNNKLFWTNDIPFFSPSDVSYGYYCISTEKHISKLGLENCSSKLYPKESIFITARGTVGEISMGGIPMAMNQSNYAINSSTHSNIHYLHQLTIQVLSQLKNQVVGAVFSALVTKDFENIDIILPKQEAIDSFESKVKCLYESILFSQKENEKLTEMLSLMA